MGNMVARRKEKKSQNRIFIPLEGLNQTLENLSKHFTVWVPMPSGENEWSLEFKPLHRGCKILLDRQSTLPPKKVILPQGQTLIEYEYKKSESDPSKQDLVLREVIDESPIIVFGTRPCDVRGFLVCDKVFLQGRYIDVYYRARRLNTLFATLFCREADDACFCSSVGSGPADMEGSDIGITPIDGGWILEGLTDRASEIFSLCDCEAPDEKQIEDARRVQEEVRSMRVGNLRTDGVLEGVKGQFQNMELWRDIAESCLSCGVCTYVCPTCYCFTITDEPQGLRGERLRSWDSCMFYQYTQEASGHNPRPTKLERYRNRLGHKFSYFPLRYSGMIACCGCGRCIRSCPVSIDIRQGVERVREAHHGCVCS
ncbi:MAG: 4Fe-4S dicluster domain-containing protein [Syntrophobacterales bacterium]|nr:4Fe-4S dicluster domain-containing protein [Syntrophobacterales bacterium]